MKRNLLRLRFIGRLDGQPDGLPDIHLPGCRTTTFRPAAGVARHPPSGRLQGLPDIHLPACCRGCQTSAFRVARHPPSGRLQGAGRSRRTRRPVRSRVSTGRGCNQKDGRRIGNSCCKRCFARSHNRKSVIDLVEWNLEGCQTPSFRPSVRVARHPPSGRLCGVARHPPSGRLCGLPDTLLPAVCACRQSETHLSILQPSDV